MARIDQRFLPPQAIRLGVEGKTADFTAETGKFYACNGPLNVQLPAPSASFHCVIKDITGNIAVNGITIVRNGSEQIDGLLSNFVLTGNNQSISLISDGTNWFIY